MKTFIHRFSPTLACTYHVPDEWWGEKWIKGRPYITWNGSPSPDYYREYVLWINEVNQQLSNEWGKKLMHCFKVSGKLEVWCYEPGIPPRLGTPEEHKAIAET
jgi:hypothetical protein